MARASGGSLAASVTVAGGFGFLSAGQDRLYHPAKLGSILNRLLFLSLFLSVWRIGYQNISWLKKELELARTLLPDTAKWPTKRLPIGIGFLGWELEQRPEALEAFEYALTQNVRAVWLSFAKDIRALVQKVREYDAAATDIENGRTLVFVQVNTTKEAIQACREYDIDVLALQGKPRYWHVVSFAIVTYRYQKDTRVEDMDLAQRLLCSHFCRQFYALSRVPLQS